MPPTGFHPLSLLCLLSAQRNHQCRNASDWLPSLCVSSLHRGVINAEMPPIGYHPSVSPLCTEESSMQRWLPSLCVSSLHRGTTNAEMPPIGYHLSVSPLCTEESSMQRCLPLATIPLCLLSAQRSHQCRDASHWLPSLCVSSLHRSHQCRDASHWLPSLCVSSLHRGTTNAEMPPIGYHPSVSPLCTEESSMQKCLRLATIPLCLLSAQRNHQCRDACHWLPSLCVSSLHRGVINAEMPPIGYRPSVSPLCTEESSMQKCLPLATIPLCLLSAQRSHQCRDASHWLPSLCVSSLHRGVINASDWLPSLRVPSYHRGTINTEMPPNPLCPLFAQESPMQRCLSLATIPLCLLPLIVSPHPPTPTRTPILLCPLSAQVSHQCRKVSIAFHPPVPLCPLSPSRHRAISTKSSPIVFHPSVPLCALITCGFHIPVWWWRLWWGTLWRCWCCSSELWSGAQGCSLPARQAPELFWNMVIKPIMFYLVSN